MTEIEPGASLPETDRPDAPAYLTRYESWTATARSSPAGGDDDGSEGGPLCLRSFRARQAAAPGADATVWQSENLGVTNAWAKVTPTREIVPERRESESGPTPLGSLQAHLCGQEIARRVMPGHRVAIAYEPTGPDNWLETGPAVALREARA